MRRRLTGRGAQVAGNGNDSGLVEPPTSEISAYVIRGLGWKLISQVLLQGTRLAVGITLARLLTPHDFGLAAMALVLTGFIVPFSDMGLGAALVQRRKLTEDDRSTVFWVSLAAGVTLSLAGLIAAPYVADFYGDSAVGPLVAVLSTSFAITALASTQRSLLARSMNFRSLELRVVAGTLVGGTVAIFLAVRGYGAWAFVGQELAFAIVSTVLLWFFVPWRPSFRFARQSLRDLGGFGVRALGGSFFSNMNQNMDNVLIGRFLGASPLGLYAFSYNLIFAPLTRIVGPIQQVFFSALSRLQDDPARLSSFWIRSNRVIVATCAPILSGLLITAPDVVPLVFGSHWDSAVPVVQILCWVGIVQCLQSLNDVVLKAGNRVTLFLRFTAGSFAVNLAAFVIGLRWGVVGVAAAFAVSSTLLAWGYTGLTTRALGIPMKQLGRALSGTAQAVIGMAAACLVVRETLVDVGAPPVVRVLVSLEVATAVYLVLVRWRAPIVIDEIRTLLSRKSRALNPRTPPGSTSGEPRLPDLGTNIGPART